MKIKLILSTIDTVRIQGSRIHEWEILLPLLYSLPVIFLFWKLEGTNVIFASFVGSMAQA